MILDLSYRDAPGKFSILFLKRNSGFCQGLLIYEWIAVSSK